MSLKNRLSATLRAQATLNDTWTRLKNTVGPAIELYRGERLAQFGFLIVFVFTFVAIFGPEIAPYEPEVTHRGDAGQVLRTAAPSSSHWLGTTGTGQDLFTQVLYGARVSVMVGFIAAFIAVFIGANVGLISAYYGGWVDDLLMRITDIAYGLPFIPFVITLVFLLGNDIRFVIIAIAAIQWRSSARVIRSEVLTQKQRPFIKSSKAIGASNFRIMYRHILPNVLPLVVLYMAFAVAYSVIAEASVAFLGFGDPELYSWGTILFGAYNSGAIRFAWWWAFPPGIALMLLVMSVFFIGRTLEKYTNPELRH